MATATSSVRALSGPAPAGAVGNDCTHYAAWDAANGGNLLQTGAIEAAPNPGALQLGERLEVAVGAIVLTQNPSVGQTEEMAKRALRGQIDGGIWISFHTAAAGNAGTENLINVTRASLPAANFTVA